MALTTNQLVVLQTDITITKAAIVTQGETLLSWWELGEHNTIALFYNEVAAPAYLVWRTDMDGAAPFNEPGFDWTDVDNLTVGKARIIEWRFRGTSRVNMAYPSNRAAVEQAFSVEAAQQDCRLAFYTAGARFATWGEQLYATGPGQLPTHHGVGPATMTHEGHILADDVTQAHLL